MYKVIKIIDKKTLIINYGLKRGAKKGKKVRIYTEGEEIVDDVGNILGRLDLIKDELEIIVPYDNFSLCQKVLVTEINPFMSLNTNSKIIKTGILDVLEEEIEEITYETYEPIKIGDLVKIL